MYLLFLMKTQKTHDKNEGGVEPLVVFLNYFFISITCAPLCLGFFLKTSLKYFMPYFESTGQVSSSTDGGWGTGKSS